MKEVSPINVLIADDHSFVRLGILSVLSDVKEINFVGEAVNGEDLTEKYFLLNPDVVMVDILMPRLSGTEAIKKLLSQGHDIKTLFITMNYGEDYKYYCHKVGGYGLIPKDLGKRELFRAIKTVNSKQYFFGDDWSEEKLNELTNKYEGCERKIEHKISYDSLTEKEKKVLYYLSEGYTSEQIAVAMFLGKRTIDSYRSTLMKKIGLKTLPELISFAIKNTPQNPFENLT